MLGLRRISRAIPRLELTRAIEAGGYSETDG